MTATEHKPKAPGALAQNAFAVVAGLFVAVGLLKFGNPVILESKISVPATTDEWIQSTWPIRLSYWGFVPLVLCGLLVGRWKTPRAKWLFVLPLVWLGWQFVSATQTVSPELTSLTLKHFTACVVCFYLGWFALAEVQNLGGFWLPVLLSFLWVIRIGFQQHSGGLQQLKEYLTVYVLPQYPNPPADLLARLEKNRIFGTLVYPNAFAGALLFLTPPLLAVVWTWCARLTVVSRVLLTGFIGVSAAACLYWTGSKTGWLLALGLVVMALLHSAISRKLKIALAVLVVAAGLTGFVVKYAGFFQKGATSVVARTDYWRAALKIFAHNPLFGSGPGTFFVSYQKIKDPSAETARLCHNDYLEQASDSGIVGFLAFSGAVLGGLAFLYRYRRKNILESAILLGLLAICLQSFLEFAFYIPALAWPTFLLMGYLLGRENGWTREQAATNLAKK